MQIRQRYNSTITKMYEIQSKKYAKRKLFGYLGQDMKKLMSFFLSPTSNFNSETFI